MADIPTSNIQEFIRRVTDSGEEIELVLSTDVEKSSIKHIEVAVLALIQREGYPRIEEYEKVVLQNVRAAISYELTRIQHIEDRYAL